MPVVTYMKLAELQNDFQRALFDTECKGADWISESARGLSARDRLDIYYNAYRFRLIDVLMDTFEHTSIYLGDDWFNQLATDYVQSHPSTYKNIGLYGKDFPGFLAEQLPEDKEVSELALLDWKLRRAFDGADSCVMTLEDLQQLAGEDDFRMQAVPTLTTCTQHFNSLEIWNAINQDQIPPKVEQLPEPIEILIWRKGHSPHFRSLAKIESVAIACVCSGDTLDDIGAVLEKDFPDVDVAAEFGVMLHRWLDDEIIGVSSQNA